MPANTPPSATSTRGKPSNNGLGSQRTAGQSRAGRQHTVARRVEHSEEITRRQERKAALQKARAEIEARARARYAVALANTRRNWPSGRPKKERGQRVVGHRSKGPTPEPGPGDHIIHRPGEPDHESGRAKHFEQEYNAQAAVEVNKPIDRGRANEPSAQEQTRTGATWPAWLRRWNPSRPS